MIYVIFFNPEAGEYQCESNKDYHEIRHYASLRGVKETDFKVINHRNCVSKKQVRNFEKYMPK